MMFNQSTLRDDTAGAPQLKPANEQLIYITGSYVDCIKMLPFKSQLPEGAWKCKVCLLMNKTARPKCAACEAVNPNFVATGPTATTAVPSPLPAVASLFAKAAPTAAANATNTGSSAPNPFVKAATGGTTAPVAGAAAPNPFLAAANAKTTGNNIAISQDSAKVNPFVAAAANNTSASTMEGAKPNPFVAAAAAKADGKAASQTPFSTQQQHSVGAAGAGKDEEEEEGRMDKYAARDHFAHIPAYDASAIVVPSGVRLSSLPHDCNDILALHQSNVDTGAAAKSVVARIDADASGQVFSWGTGDCDQLGHGDEEYIQPTPRLIRSLIRLPITRIAAGGLHTLAITADGRLWSWGCNDDGALGRKGAENRPGRVRGLLNDVPVVSVATGDSHSMALDAEGKVYAWGTYKGASGHLGFDATTTKQMEPRFMEAVWKQYGPVISLSSGADHSAVVSSEGVGVAWGYGAQGQLGRNITEVSLRGNRTSAIHLTPHAFVIPTVGGAKGTRRTPAFASPVAGKKRKNVEVDLVDIKRQLVSGRDATKPRVIRAFACGYSTFIVVRYPRSVDAEGSASAVVERVFACGLNSYGQLGIGNVENIAALAHVSALDTTAEHDGRDNVISIVGGNQHTLFLRSNGAVFACGRGDSGQLGLSVERHERLPMSCSTFIPRQLDPAKFNGLAVAQISASSCTSAAVTADGGVYAWGFGENSQLASGLDQDENTPFCILAGPKHPAPPKRGKHDPAGDMKGATALLVGVGGQHIVTLATSAPIVASVTDEEATIVEDPIAPDLSDDEEDGVGEDNDGSDDEGSAAASSSEEEEVPAAPAAKRSRKEKA